jgi:hypothetical protein
MLISFLNLEKETLNMQLAQYQQIDLPATIKEILNQNMLNPPSPIGGQELLANESVDHVAIALNSYDEFDGLYRELANTYPLLEDKHVWPKDLPGCPQVPLTDLKYMVSFKVRDTRLVLLCAYSQGDVIDNFVRHAGGAALHHIALTVSNLAIAMKLLVQDFPSIRQITPLAKDSGFMSQVFFQLPDEPRIIELVERENDFQGTFTCPNVQQLTEGERLNWRTA